MTAAKIEFERVALIGLGLIGSSLSHAMRRAGLARSIKPESWSRWNRISFAGLT